jgi:hypothetical protein
MTEPGDIDPKLLPLVFAILIALCALSAFARGVM